VTLPTDGDTQLVSPQAPSSLAQMSPISPQLAPVSVHAPFMMGSVIASVSSWLCVTAAAVAGSVDPPHAHLPPVASQPLPAPMSGCTP
jgi:hypothetical protein